MSSRHGLDGPRFVFACDTKSGMIPTSVTTSHPVTPYFPYAR